MTTATLASGATNIRALASRRLLLIASKLGIEFPRPADVLAGLQGRRECSMHSLCTWLGTEEAIDTIGQIYGRTKPLLEVLEEPRDTGDGCDV